MKAAHRAAALSLLSFSAAASPSDAQESTIVELGSPASREFVVASGISEAGHVVGSGFYPGLSRAFLWHEGRMRVLPLLPGFDRAVASGVNAWGEVCGHCDDGLGTSRACVWRGEDVIDLGTLPGGSDSSALDINDLGQVVGVSSTGAGSNRAFLWQSGAMVELGALAPDHSSVAYAINEIGDVVGQSGVGPATRPFVVAGGIMAELPPFSPGAESFVNDINDLGHAVGRSANKAVVWRDGGVLDLEASDFVATAYAINNRGQIVGRGREAFIWEEGRARNLGDGAVGTDAWSLENARGISDAGEVIGYGAFGTHQTRGFILYLPCAANENMAGTVNTGGGSAPVDVLTVNGRTGGSCRRLVVRSDESISLGIAAAPSLPGRGHFAAWVLDGAPAGGAEIPIRMAGPLGLEYELGVGPRCLPVSNTLAPLACPCPSTVPKGLTSRSLGASLAANLCLPARTPRPRAPTALALTLPPGIYTFAGVVQDSNGPHSPALNVSIGNWIVVHVEP